MNAKARRQVEFFLARVEQRIAQERALAGQGGLRRTAREAAGQRADAFERDLAYLRAMYTPHLVLIGEGASA